MPTIDLQSKLLALSNTEGKSHKFRILCCIELKGFHVAQSKDLVSRFLRECSCLRTANHPYNCQLTLPELVPCNSKWMTCLGSRPSFWRNCTAGSAFKFSCIQTLVNCQNKFWKLVCLLCTPQYGSLFDFGKPNGTRSRISVEIDRLRGLDASHTSWFVPVVPKSSLWRICSTLRITLWILSQGCL